MIDRTNNTAVDVADYWYQQTWITLVEQFGSELKQYKTFGQLNDISNRSWLVEFHNQTFYLWAHSTNLHVQGSTEHNKLYCDNINWLNLNEWRLPTKKELLRFARNEKNPMRKANSQRLNDNCFFIVKEGCIDIDYSDPAVIPYKSATSIPFIALSQERFIDLITGHQVKKLTTLSTPDNNLLARLQQIKEELLGGLDYRINRLPKIDTLTLTDINKGLWELWGSTPETCEKLGIRPRDPARDIRPGCVAIDFGTSSTVVAYESENGRKQLMRVGARNFYDRVEPHHLENPTVLEIRDFEALQNEWNHTAYRPQLNWEWVRCSHEAQAQLRDNRNDIDTISSILTRLKQWALRQSQDHQVVFTDRFGVEHTLAALTQNNPTRGAPLVVDENTPFDPIELYAWFLGMTINWRGRGIYLEYFMTFPVEYPREVKEKILASFKRGLQRSLPPTLVSQHEYLNAFSVEELASEPAAYAVSALSAMDVQPGTTGTAYAVFDFGGGTTDFDFGYYRLPSEDEEDEGFEQVFEHFSPSGDKFLGGENLLENMAYRVFRHNLDICQKYEIAFTRPLDADDFAGSESYLEKTQAAYSNTLLLISELRPFWESQEESGSRSDETRTVDLFDRAGKKVSADFVIPFEILSEYLDQRISLGIDKFITALGLAFTPLPPEIHVLLAGNASRSQWIARLWGLDRKTLTEAENNPSWLPDFRDIESPLIEQKMRQRFGDNAPVLHVHPPLPSDPTNPWQPTAKTGVALGLLDLRPGGVIKVVNHTRQQSKGEAGFAWNVGRVKQGLFHAGLTINAAYEQWFELGPQREGIFELLYTQSPMAQGGALSATDSEVKRLRLRLAVNQRGHRVFAMALAPDQIRLVTAESAESLAKGEMDNLQQVTLK
ncbi:hypothetical protein [Enterobacter sp.]|uniref:hypothetical protein n=2 Tax=Enterobacter sp. TaxID=42895 RepID=UPI00296FBE35|nr:hypothetical protein [Enterobacter sp.]